MTDQDRQAADRKIIEEFRANEGRVGGRYEGVPMIVIHHVGARTGVERETPLAYFPDGDDRMINIASNTGRPENPAWYHNVKANPAIDVERGTDTLAVTVDEVSGDEREQIWKRVVAIAPAYAAYQKGISRLLPVLRLTPAA